MNITSSPINKLIFVYSKPKVGSTSLVSSIRIFASQIYNVIHVHDENMLKVLGHISNITINEIILYNKYIGKEVFVIDVYRCPIERKISTFFEKIDCYHFNNTCEEINKYNINKIINRFNKVFPHIALGDHFIDTYNIPIPDNFDNVNKYMCIEHEGIKYIKLRLKDSNEWGNILTKILGHRIQIVKDYATENKTIKKMYLLFREKYRVPINYLNELNECKYLNYYYSQSEKKEYINSWTNKTSGMFVSFTSEEYKFYEKISMENSHLDMIQYNHYLDEGCICKVCNIKRSSVANKILKGIQVDERIIHNKVKEDYMKYKINVINKINAYRTTKSRLNNHNSIVMSIQGKPKK